MSGVRNRAVRMLAALGATALLASACAGSEADPGESVDGSRPGTTESVDESAEQPTSSATPEESDPEAGTDGDVYTLQGDTVSGEFASDDGDLQVHFAQYWSGLPVLASFRDELVNATKEHYPDVELSVSDGQNDPGKLVADIEDAIARGVDAIIVNAGDGQVPVPAVERAVAQGIPVVAMQKRIATDDVTATVVADDVEQGRLQGEALVDALEQRNGSPEGKLVIVNGIAGASLTVEQNEGFREAIGAHDGIEIVCDQPGNFARDQSTTVLENCLQANPDADAVWYLGADVGPALASTLERLGKAEQVVVVGGGGNMETLAVIRDGGPIVHDQVFPSGALPAIGATARLLEGEEVPSEIVVHSPGVTPQNVDKFYNEDQGYVYWPTELPQEWN